MNVTLQAMKEVAQEETQELHAEQELLLMILKPSLKRRSIHSPLFAKKKKRLKVKNPRFQDASARRKRRKTFTHRPNQKCR